MSRGFRQVIGDARYFFSVETLLVLVGTAALAVMGLPELRVQVRPLVPPMLWDFGKDWVLVVVIISAGCVVLPPPIAKGVLHLRQRRAGLYRNAELSAVTGGLSDRIANLITKAKRTMEGNFDNQYQNHTLEKCCDFFRTRAHRDLPGLQNAAIEVYSTYFEFNRTLTRPAFLERKIQTHTEVGSLRPR